MFRKLIIPVIFIIALTLAWTNDFFKTKYSFHKSLTGQTNISQAIAKIAQGTKTQAEHEIKFHLENQFKNKSEFGMVYATLLQELEEKLYDKYLWQVPQILKSNYQFGKTGKGTFTFLDIYLDSPDKVLAKLNCSYRVRYRWKSHSSLINYFLGSRILKDLPYRCEFQFKSYKKEESNLRVNETRFEFRNESQPFKEKSSAPKPPWAFEEYIKAAATGKYKSYQLNTSQELAKIASTKLGIKTLKLSPALLIITKRKRLHMLIENPYGLISAKKGYGAQENAAQALFFTVDHSKVFSTELLNIYNLGLTFSEKHSLTKRLARRLKRSFESNLNFTEVEIEFERNIASALNDAIAKQPHNSQPVELKQAFLKDRDKLKEIISTIFEDMGHKLTPSFKSKYQKALNKIQIKNSD